MFDSPKAAHFAAFDHAGRRLHYTDQRGLDARWLAAKHATAAGVDFLTYPTVEMLAQIMEACAVASAQIGVRVRLDDAELEFLKRRAQLREVQELRESQESAVRT